MCNCKNTIGTLEPVDVLRTIQREHKSWADYNFGGTQLNHAFMGMAEELGELAHALLKQQQAIRTNENHKLDAIDAVCDLLIYTCSLANVLQIDLSIELQHTWNKVKQRDWKKYPKNGIPDGGFIPSEGAMNK